MNGVAFGKVRLLYSDKNLSWETNLNLEYGLSYIDQKNDAFQKSSDVIDFNTKLGWQFHKAWYLTASAGFKSQFAFGRAYDGTDAPDPIISKFLSPSYTDISVGLDWKPNSIFSLYLSPVAGKITTAYVGDAVENANPGLRQQMQEKYATWVYSKEANADGTYDKIYRNCKAELGLSFKGGINYAYKDLQARAHRIASVAFGGGACPLRSVGHRGHRGLPPGDVLGGRGGFFRLQGLL